jgi:hypothetical protein
MRGGVAGVRAYRHLESRARLVVLALRGVQHCQIVVRLGQLRKFLGQLREYLDRVVGLVLLGEDDAFQEAAARILGIFCEIRVDPVERAVELSLLEELVRVLQLLALSEDRRCAAHAGKQRHGHGEQADGA